MLIAIAAAIALAPPQADKPMVVAHYMPWFEAKPARGWGWHWTMGVRNPDVVKDGKPEIAAHFIPEIGPYDSADPHVLEYQTLLMRFAGIEGVILDWYGTEDVHDYASIHQNSLKFIQAAKRAGLKYAICYEDQTLPQIIKAGKIKEDEAIAHAKKQFDWMAEHWFSDPDYIRLDGKPLVLVFGPQHFKGDEWPQITGGRSALFGVMGPHRFGNGGFAWPNPKGGDETSNADMAAFYRRAETAKPFLAAAYPRFRDYYQEAGIHASYGTVSDLSGQTFRRTFRRAIDSRAPLIQLVTWNDWGEGTQIEPSLEFGDRDLRATQEIVKRHIDPSLPFSPVDLKEPKRLLDLRRAGNQVEANALAENLYNRLKNRRS